MTEQTEIPVAVQEALRSLVASDAMTAIVDRQTLDRWVEELMVCPRSLLSHTVFLRTALDISPDPVLGVLALDSKSEQGFLAGGPSTLSDSSLRRLLLAEAALWPLSEDILADLEEAPTYWLAALNRSDDEAVQMAMTRDEAPHSLRLADYVLTTVTQRRGIRMAASPLHTAASEAGGAPPPEMKLAEILDALREPTPREWTVPGTGLRFTVTGEPARDELYVDISRPDTSVADKPLRVVIRHNPDDEYPDGDYAAQHPVGSSAARLIFRDVPIRRIVGFVIDLNGVEAVLMPPRQQR